MEAPLEFSKDSLAKVALDLSVHKWPDKKPGFSQKPGFTEGAEILGSSR